MDKKILEEQKRILQNFERYCCRCQKIFFFNAMHPDNKYCGYCHQFNHLKEENERLKERNRSLEKRLEERQKTQFEFKQQLIFEE